MPIFTNKFTNIRCSLLSQAACLDTIIPVLIGDTSKVNINFTTVYTKKTAEAVLYYRFNIMGSE